MSDEVTPAGIGDDTGQPAAPIQAIGSPVPNAPPPTIPAIGSQEPVPIPSGIGEQPPGPARVIVSNMQEFLHVHIPLPPYGTFIFKRPAAIRWKEIKADIVARASNSLMRDENNLVDRNAFGLRYEMYSPGIVLRATIESAPEGISLDDIYNEEDLDTLYSAWDEWYSFPQPTA